ncbi:MAG: response regulator [Acidobacteria bacterium]|nr:response regulator [Acidobacteriota bacterium]
MPSSLRLLVAPGQRLPVDALARALEGRGFSPIVQALDTTGPPFAATDGVPTVLLVPDPPPPGVQSTVDEFRRLGLDLLTVAGRGWPAGSDGARLERLRHGHLVADADLPPGLLALIVDQGLRLESATRRQHEMEAVLVRRRHQQQVVVELGQQALAARDVHELIDRGLDAVAEALGVTMSALVERVQGFDLQLRAGTGWAAGVVGRPISDASFESMVGLGFKRGEPVVIEDVSSWAGGVAPPLLRRHGIVSLALAALPGPDGPLGVLVGCATSRQTFSREDVYFLQATANVLAAAIDRRAAEDGLIQSQIRLQSVQKMEAIGRLAGGIAHDFNNLVQAIGGYTEILLKRLPEHDPLHRHAEEIKKAGDRAAALTRQLLAFSRQQVLQPKVLALNSVVQNIEQLLRRLIGEDIELETELEADLGSVRADAAQLEQVLMNLAVNARDAMPDGGTLTIETRNVVLTKADQREAFAIKTGPYVMLAVSDTGVGMSPDTRARAFEPFFTTKAPGQGTGLGLSTVYGVVKQSDGYIWVDSEPEMGTRVRIYLPRVDAAPDPTEIRRRGPAVAVPRGHETLLLVEDEEGVRELIREWMGGHGYTVLTAAHGNEALQRATSYDGPIHLLIADVVMPQMGGPALAQALQPLRPEMRIIYVSGYADEAIGDPRVLEAGAAFLQKPFTLDSLLRKVREILDAAGETGR